MLDELSIEYTINIPNVFNNIIFYLPYTTVPTANYEHKL